MTQTIMVLSATLLMSFANVRLYAQACEKCCGLWHLEEISHRACEPSRLCHVSQCDMGKGPDGTCCWQVLDHYNDVCTDYEATEWGLHGCHDE